MCEQLCLHFYKWMDWGVIWFVHKNPHQTWWSRYLMVFFGRKSCKKMLGEIRGSDRRWRLFGTGLRSGCRCRYLSHLLQYYHNITTFMVLKLMNESVWMPVPHEHPVFGQEQWVLSVSLSVPALLQRFQPALHLHTVLWAQSPLVPLCPQTTEDHHHLRPPLPHKQTERGGLSGVRGTWFGIFCNKVTVKSTVHSSGQLKQVFQWWYLKNRMTDAI